MTPKITKIVQEVELKHKDTCYKLAILGDSKFKMNIYNMTCSI